MERFDPRRIARIAAAPLLLAPLLSGGWAQPAVAATGVQSLVSQAIRNTDTVNTIVHHDQSRITEGTSSLRVTGHGAEDEVQNREQDFESVTVTAPGRNGSPQTLHYTLDVIFIKGYTYYRSSLQKNQWKRQKGTTFNDPLTGKFKRARTKVVDSLTEFKIGAYRQIGTSAGQTQVRAPLTKKNTVGTVDFWVSGGATPYIVREDITAHATTGAASSVSVRTDYGPFNRPVTIQPPITTGST